MLLSGRVTHAEGKLLGMICEKHETPLKLKRELRNFYAEVEDRLWLNFRRVVQDYVEDATQPDEKKPRLEIAF
jgi:hypothetical protein